MLPERRRQFWCRDRQRWITDHISYVRAENYLLSLHRQNQQARTGWVLPPEFDVTRLSWTRRQLAAVGGRQLPPGVIDRHARDDVIFDRLDRLVVWCCLSGCREDCRPLMPDGSRQPRQSTEWRYVESTAGRVYRFRVDARQEVGGVGVLDAAGSFLLTTVALDLRVDELVRLVRWHLVREFCRLQRYSLLIAGPQPGLSFSRVRAVPDLPDRDCGRVRAARIITDVPGLAVRAAVPPAPPAVRRVVLGGGGGGADGEFAEAGGNDTVVGVPVHSSRVPVLRVEPRRTAERHAASTPPPTGRNRASRELSPALPTFHEMLAAARAEAEASAENAASAGQFVDAEEEADREVHQIIEQRFSPICGRNSDTAVHNENRGARLAGLPVYSRGGTPPDDSQYDSDSDQEMPGNVYGASPETTVEAEAVEIDAGDVLPRPPGAHRRLGQYRMDQQRLVGVCHWQNKV